MRTVLVLFTHDLRVHDHPALHAAVEGADLVVPLFVLDPRILRGAARNRIAYLAEALEDLRGALRDRGGDLVVRTGDGVEEAVGVARAGGAEAIHLSRGVSSYAAARARRLRAAAREAGIGVEEFPGLTVVPPGEVVPAKKDHYRVFTPYWRAWEAHGWRDPLLPPRAVRLPGGLANGGLPDGLAAGRGIGPLSPERIRGGERRARARMRRWLESGLGDYPERHDDLAGDATSRLSAHLRFGCLSPLEPALAARGRPGGEEFVRQLAWRDFHHQVAAAFPELNKRDYRPRDTGWIIDPQAFDAWRRGRTGVPIVDAGMRQLLREGYMHNRARLITAAFLVRVLRVHWKEGADHFHALLTDGDVADNYGNWQWVAGTGNDTRPGRRFNLLRQARRFDPEGDYVRRHVPELAGLPGRRAHTPWREERMPDGYPPPLVELED